MIEGGINKRAIHAIFGWIVFLVITVIMLMYAFKVQDIKDVKDGVDLQIWMWFYSLFVSIIVGAIAGVMFSPHY